MSKENSDKSVLGGIFVLIAFTIYVFGIIQTANNFSKEKALSAFLIPPYGFYMGIKGMFSSDHQKENTSTEENTFEKLSKTERLAKENVENEITRANSASNTQDSDYAPQTKLQLMQEMAISMSRGLPHTENGMRLDKIIVIDDHTYGYESTLLNFATYTDELLKNSQTIKNELLQSACSTPNNIKAAQSGTSAVFNYYALDGSLLVSIEITPADCGF